MLFRSTVGAKWVIKAILPSGLQGSPGPRGPIGSQGTAGLQGDIGPTGPRGTAGKDTSVSGIETFSSGFNEPFIPK